jgi:hypothetical protein
MQMHPNHLVSLTRVYNNHAQRLSFAVVNLAENSLLELRRWWGGVLTFMCNSAALASGHLAHITQKWWWQRCQYKKGVEGSLD